LAQALKKHPIGCSFGTELCVRSCSVDPILIHPRPRWQQQK